MTSSHVDMVLKPANTEKRIATLDTIRGLALLGILLTTAPKFAFIDGTVLGFLKLPESLNYKLAYFIALVFEGKMRGLFSLLFGASVILFIGDKEKAGQSVAPIYYRRMGWLAVFGLLHSHVLLATGEILFLFALCGMVLFLFRNANPTWLLVAAFSVTTLEMAADTYFFNKKRLQHSTYSVLGKLEKKEIPVNNPQSNVSAAKHKEKVNFFSRQEGNEEEIEIMRSGYWTVAEKLRDGLIKRQTTYFPFLMVDPLAVMLIGMALFRLGFFSGHLDRRIYLWTVVIGYGIGLPLAFYHWKNAIMLLNVEDYMKSNTYNIGIYIYPVQRILIVLGHTSLILLLIRAGIFKHLASLLAAVGKMAFSNYILQTIFCTLIFFGYGLGYYERLEYHEVFYVVLAIWIVHLSFSALWLKYFRYGPLEWVWRSLTYWQRQPLRLNGTDKQL